MTVTNKPKDEQQSQLDEIHEIMFLFRGDNATRDGDYRSEHLGTVLEYLRNQHEEDLKTTSYKLPLLIGLGSRRLKEDYLNGLIAWGIIALDSKCLRWKWIGAKAIKGKYGKLRKNTVEDNEFVSKQLRNNGENKNE